VKALTLWEPWASLIAMKRKTAETRSWACPPDNYGRRIAIHAGRRVERELAAYFSVDPLPGYVVATAVLTQCVRVESHTEGFAHCRTIRQNLITVPEDQYGDFSTGRWLWLLEDIAAVPEPFEAVGAQGLWPLSNGQIAELHRQGVA